MPFYEYQCEACGHHHEAMQKMSDAPLKTCPHCGKARLKRLISAPVFRLKGGGWYETDFKSGSKKNVIADEKKSGEEKKAGDGAASKDAAKSASDAPAKSSSDSAKPAKSESSD